MNNTSLITLSGTNTYSGATTIAATGLLQISTAATATYGANGAVTNNRSLTFAPAAGQVLTFGAPISGVAMRLISILC